MKKALINPIDKIDSKDVVVAVSENEFPASIQYFWVDCDDSVQSGWLYDNGQFSEPFIPPPPPPPKPTPTAEENKARAMQRLINTDWVEVPSVTDLSSIPHLLNKNEFLPLRAQARQIAVNPIEGNIDWIVKPQEQWSS